MNTAPIVPTPAGIPDLGPLARPLRVMLVFPPVVNTRYTNNISCMPMGLSYIAAVLREAGHEVRILDAAVEGYHHVAPLNKWLQRFGLPGEETAARIQDFRPDVLGVSVLFSNQLPAAKDIVRRAKDVVPGVVTITGGTHPSFFPERTLAEEDAFDFVGLGEGEYVMRELCHRLAANESTSDVPGVAYRTDDGYQVNPRMPLVENIDEIPFPARDLLPMEKYFEVNVPMQTMYKRTPNISFVSSRGCPFKCTFCSSTRHWGNNYRARSPENCIAEMRELIDTWGVREIKFEDDNLTFDKDRAKNLFRAMIDNNIDLTWNTPNGISVWTLDDEVIDLAKKSGCYEFTLAIESGNQSVLKRLVKKPLKLSIAEEMADKIKKAGIETAGYFIIGFPGETRAQIQDTFDFARKLALDRAYIFIYNPLPGTPLFEKCLAEGFITDDWKSEEDNYFTPRFSTPEFSAEELLKWQRREFWKYNFSFLARDPVRFMRKYKRFFTRPGMVVHVLKSAAGNMYSTLNPARAIEQNALSS